MIYLPLAANESSVPNERQKENRTKKKTLAFDWLIAFFFLFSFYSVVNQFRKTQSLANCDDDMANAINRQKLNIFFSFRLDHLPLLGIKWMNEIKIRKKLFCEIILTLRGQLTLIACFRLLKRKTVNERMKGNRDSVNWNQMHA